MNTNESDLRVQLLRRLQGVGAHMPYDQAVKDFPMDSINEKFPNGTYSAYGVLEHLRYTQWDMLDYCKNPNYNHGNWPNDYWPDPEYKATPEDWQKSIDAFLSNRAEFEAWVQDETFDLTQTVPSHGEHTILREILQVAAHNAYHIGEFAIMRQVMGTWPADRSG